MLILPAARLGGRYSAPCFAFERCADGGSLHQIFRKFDAVALEVSFGREFGKRAGWTLIPARVGAIGGQFLAHFHNREHAAHRDMESLRAELPHGWTRGLNQEGTTAPTRFNLTEKRRSVAAERRAKTHFGREHPIAPTGLARKRRGGYGRDIIESERQRRESVKGVKLRNDKRHSSAAGKNVRQREARGCSRRNR